MPAAVLGLESDLRCLRRCETHRLLWQAARGRSESKDICKNGYINIIYVNDVYNVYVNVYIYTVYIYLLSYLCIQYMNDKNSLIETILLAQTTTWS